LQVKILEGLLGSVKQDPEVVTVHPKFAADLIFIPFLQVDRADQAAVALGQSLENLRDFCLHLFGRNRAQHVDDGIRKILLWLAFERTVARGSAIVLEQHVVADRIHECSQPSGWRTPSGLRSAAKTRAKASCRTSSMA